LVMSCALQALASFAPGVMAKGRGDQEQGDREGLTEG
jgi:hypothetical protein